MNNTLLLAAPVYGFTPERSAAFVGAAAGLIAVIIGVLALRRFTRRASRIAVGTGLIGSIIGMFIIVTADGGPGTGNGIVGGVVALALGALGIALGGRALTRSRKSLR